MDGNYMSRLELVALRCSISLFLILTYLSAFQCRSNLVNSGAGSLELNFEEQGVLTAGAVAREVLRE